MATKNVAAGTREDELSVALGTTHSALWITQGLVRLICETVTFQSENFDSAIAAAIRAIREVTDKALAETESVP
jgi:hypothetical protein